MLEKKLRKVVFLGHQMLSAWYFLAKTPRPHARGLPFPLGHCRKKRGKIILSDLGMFVCLQLGLQAKVAKWKLFQAEDCFSLPQQIRLDRIGDPEPSTGLHPNVGYVRLKVQRGRWKITLPYVEVLLLKIAPVPCFQPAHHRLFFVLY